MTFKRQIASLELVPVGGGRFEVYIDGEEVYSKADTGEFPEHEEIVEAIRERL